MWSKVRRERRECIYYPREDLLDAALSSGTYATTFDEL